MALPSPSLSLLAAIAEDTSLDDERVLAAVYTPRVLPVPLAVLLLCDFAEHALRGIEDARDVDFADIHAGIEGMRARARGAVTAVVPTPALAGLLAEFRRYTQDVYPRRAPGHVLRAVALYCAHRYAEVTTRDGTGAPNAKRYARVRKRERAWQRARTIQVLTALRDGRRPPPIGFDDNRQDG